VRIRFDRIIIQDFKAFDGKHVFDIAEYGAGLHYVAGRNKARKRLGANGVGKSSIWDALCWCIYGQTAAGLRNPDVLPWKPSKGSKTKVVVWVSLDGVHHSIERTIKPNAVRIDGKDSGNPGDWLGLPFDVFTNAVLLGQGRPLFFDLTPKDKMGLFSDALDLVRWEDRADAASSRVKAISGQVIDANTEYSAAVASVKELTTVHETTRKERDAWTEAQQRRIEDEVKSRKELQTRHDKLEKLLGDAVLKNENAEMNLRGLLTDVREADRNLAKSDALVAKLEERSQAMRERLEEATRNLKNAGRAKKCPECGTVLKKASREDHIAELGAKLKKLAAEGRDLEKEFEAALRATEKNRKTAKRLFDTAKDYQKEADDSRSAIDTMGPDVARMKAELKGSRDKTKAEEATVNPHDEQLAKVRKSLKHAQARQDDLRDEIDALERKAARSRFWIKGFKDVRLFVLEELLHELELVTNSMLDESGLVGWRVEYQLEHETKRGTISQGLSIFIQSPESKGKVRWESWSGGEGQRLRVVGALALSEVLLAHAGAKTNLEILDEPTQHLSMEGVDDMIDYLAERAKVLKKSIFYVDHVAIESSKFTTSTLIVRDDQGSFIKEVR
jgi:DNA repair exonuclease SbcCD ATPase subunit